MVNWIVRNRTLWPLNKWQGRHTLHSSQLQDWTLTIKWFSVKSGLLFVGPTPLYRCSQCILQLRLIGLMYLFSVSESLNVLYNCGRIFFILSFFIGYILSFSLVRLRTIRLCARVGAYIERRCSHSCGEDVTITDVIIKTPDRKWDWDMNDIMPGSDELRILGDFWKKAVSWDSKWVDFWTWARPVQLWTMGCPHVVGSDGTVSIVEIVSLSSCQKT